MSVETAVQTAAKPANKFAPPDWFTSNNTISANATRQRDAAEKLRQQGRFLRNETDNKTHWDTTNNNTRLDDRVIAIDNWKTTLERTLHNLDNEIEALTMAKKVTESSLAAKAVNLNVAVENLTLRDGRVKIDNVKDEVEGELEKEVNVIEGIKRNLQQKCAQAFEQICLLQEARQQIRKDLQDKVEALSIDTTQRNLNQFSHGISFKPDPLRVPKGSTTPQEWDDFSMYNKNRADAEMAASVKLREAMQATLMQSDNDLEAQKTGTEYAFRRRLHEMTQAKNELEWQQKQTADEIMAMEADIRALEKAIQDKRNPLKLAHSRLENRTARPNIELCRDAVQYKLSDEVKQLEATLLALQEKLDASKHSLNCLQGELGTINADLAVKTNSLKLDNMCLDSRQKLEARPWTTTGRNLTLTGIEKESHNILAA
jgi:tektin-2